MLNLRSRRKGSIPGIESPTLVKGLQVNTSFGLLSRSYCIPSWIVISSHVQKTRRLVCSGTFEIQIDERQTVIAFFRVAPWRMGWTICEVCARDGIPFMLINVSGAITNAIMGELDSLVKNRDAGMASSGLQMISIELCMYTTRPTYDVGDPPYKS